MARKKRKTPGINGSSSADIAFMLLIFFLITTSMDTDKGLKRRLPPLPNNKQQDTPPVDINERNIMRLLVNRYDEVVISRGSNFVPVKLDKLKEEVVDFVFNPNNDPNKTDKEVRDVPGLGNVSVVTTGYAISLKLEIETSYQMYIAVQNELLAAYKEVWDLASRKLLNKPFEDLQETQREAIKSAYPMNISEMPLSNLKKK